MRVLDPDPLGLQRRGQARETRSARDRHDVALADVVVVRHEPPFGDRIAGRDVRRRCWRRRSRETIMNMHSCPTCDRRPLERADRDLRGVVRRHVRRRQLRGRHRRPVVRIRRGRSPGLAWKRLDDDARRRLRAAVLDLHVGEVRRRRRSGPRASCRRRRGAGSRSIWLFQKTGWNGYSPWRPSSM